MIDLNTKKATQIAVNGDIPESRCFNSFTWYKNDLYIVGGVTLVQYFFFQLIIFRMIMENYRRNPHYSTTFGSTILVAICGKDVLSG